MSELAEQTALRLQLRDGGFAPLPVSGKAPSMREWQKKFDATPNEIRLWEKLYSYDLNTGVLCRFTPAIDIDITGLEAAEAIEDLAREHFEERGPVLIRVGLPPKRLIPLRTREPFTKTFRTLFAPNGSEQRVEVLGDGQQFVAFGIHPETRRPYAWHGGTLGEIQHHELPYMRESDARAFLDDAAKLLVADFGFKESGSKQQQSGARAPWRELATNGVAEGARNTTIARFAGHLFRRYVDPLVVLELLLSWNATHCRPPLDQDEVFRTIDSIARKELKRRSGQ